LRCATFSGALSWFVEAFESEAIADIVAEFSEGLLSRKPAEGSGAAAADEFGDLNAANNRTLHINSGGMWFGLNQASAEFDTDIAEPEWYAAGLDVFLHVVSKCRA
jgi:hypothetical protein